MSRQESGRRGDQASAARRFHKDYQRVEHMGGKACGSRKYRGKVRPAAPFLV